MGSTFFSMKNRLSFLNDLVKEGKITVSPDQTILFLVGHRLLRDDEKKAVNSKGYSNIDNENGLPGVVWNCVDLCPALKGSGIQAVYAKKKDGDSRARTDDNGDSLLQLDVKDFGNVLVVSGNPFVEYQRLSIETRLKRGKGKCGQIDGCGPSESGQGLSQDLQMGIILDALARTLYAQLQ